MNNTENAMHIDLELDARTVKQEFQFHIQYKDVASFLELCQTVKSTIGALINQNQRAEALALMEVYESTFKYAHDWNAKFLLGIVEEFPFNHESTFALLGLSDELDQAIMASKVDTKTRPANNICDHDHLLRWAYEQQNLALMEDIVINACDMVKTRFHCEKDIMRRVSTCFVHTLGLRENRANLSSHRIDEAIASIIDIGDQESGAYVDRLARLQMPKTLMKMLEIGRLGKHIQALHEDYDHILACIPEKMTANELNAVYFHLEPTGLAQKILFDESIDMDDYIGSLRNSAYMSFGGSKYLGLQYCSHFSASFTENAFSDSVKKRRCVKLINSMCEADLTKGTVKVKDMRDRAILFGVPTFCLKYIDCIRGAELEDALGL